MKTKTLSIRPFLGAKDFDASRRFYNDLGFTEIPLGPDLCLFKNDALGFYLQRAYVRDWVDNTMVFLEVDDVQACWDELQSFDLPANHNGVRLTPIRTALWGRECFVHDPSGILWHFGEFYNKTRA